jgi:hypothetical protein
MIVLNLVCIAGHRFEGWFASVDAFDDQVAKELVGCPHCNSREVQRLPSTPHLARQSSPDSATSTDESNGGMNRLAEELRRLSDASEDVGERFADEARRIHYREARQRAIRGQATMDDTRDLLEEGILVLPVPAKRH